MDKFSLQVRKDAQIVIDTAGMKFSSAVWQQQHCKNKDLLEGLNRVVAKLREELDRLRPSYHNIMGLPVNVEGKDNPNGT